MTVLQKTRYYVESLFTDLNTQKHEVDQIKQELGVPKYKSQLQQKKSFQIGFRFGISVISLLFVFLLMQQFDAINSFESDFSDYLFYIFRGSLLLYIFMFLYGIDIYLWNKYNINYQYIFNIQGKAIYQQHIVSASLGFICIWSLIFAYCILCDIKFIKSKTGVFQDIFSFYIAPLVWFQFILYLVNPFHIFGESRYKSKFKDFCINIAKGIYKPQSYLYQWGSGQFISMTVILNDFLYTIFFMIYFDKNTKKITIQNKQRFELWSFVLKQIMLIIEALFLISNIRYYIQNQAKNDTKYKYYQKLTTFMISITSMLLTLINNQLYNYIKTSNLSFVSYISLTIFISIFTCFNDIFFSWQLLKEKNLLRKNLLIDRKSVYYSCMFLNILFRFNWNFQFISFTNEQPYIKNFLVLIIGFVESIRRAISNFLCLEVMQINNNGNFNSIKQYDFPFKVLNDFDQEDTKKIVNQQFNNYVLKFSKRDVNLSIFNQQIIRERYQNISDYKNQNQQQELDFQVCFLTKQQLLNEYYNLEQIQKDCEQFIQELLIQILTCKLNPINNIQKISTGKMSLLEKLTIENIGELGEIQKPNKLSCESPVIFDGKNNFKDKLVPNQKE